MACVPVGLFPASFFILLVITTIVKTNLASVAPRCKNIPCTSGAFSRIASGQTSGPLGYSIATPRPISPAQGATNPSAQATQRQNPYLGSVPSKNTDTTIELSLKGAIERGLRYNLGWIESTQANADVRAERLPVRHCCRNSRRTVARPSKHQLSPESGVKTTISGLDWFQSVDLALVCP